MSESYAGQQIVGVDLHRRRSVIVRMTEAGEHLETVRILNDRERLAAVMAQAGESPEVVLEATYGWYWAADALGELGAKVHPLAAVGRLSSWPGCRARPPGSDHRSRGHWHNVAKLRRAYLTRLHDTKTMWTPMWTSPPSWQPQSACSILMAG